MEFDKINLIKIARIIDSDFFTLLKAKELVEYWAKRVLGVEKGEFEINRYQLLSFMRVCRNVSKGIWYMENGRLMRTYEIDFDDLIKA